MIYRYNVNGVQITIDARDEQDALARLARIKQDYKRELANKR